jgi:hypothetical protein
LLAATSAGFNEVIEFGSFVQFASLLLATNTSLTYDSVAGCMCFTQRWTILLLITAGSDPSHGEKSM